VYHWSEEKFASVSRWADYDEISVGWRNREEQAAYFQRGSLEEAKETDGSWFFKSWCCLSFERSGLQLGNS